MSAEPALQQIADPRRILYGSDWPFTPLPIVARLALAQAQGATPLLDAAARRRVLHDNALALFPRAITAFAQTSDSGLVVPGSALAAVNRKLTAVSALERERGGALGEKAKYHRSAAGGENKRAAGRESSGGSS